MNSFERFYRVFGHEELDRVPTWEPAVDLHVLGRALGRTISSLRSVVRGWIDVGYDMVTIGHIWGKEACTRWINEKTYVDCWGGIRHMGERGRPFLVGGTITPRNIEGFVPPDPEDEEVVESIRNAVKTADGEVPLVGYSHDALTLPYTMRGLSNLLADYIRNPGFVHKLCEIAMKFNEKLTKLYIESGCSAILTGDDYAYKSGPFMSPKHFDEFVSPYLKRIVDITHRGGAVFIKHTDGNVWPLMDRLINIGIDCLNPIERQAGMNLEEVKVKVGDKLTLSGNVDCGRVLQDGTEYETVKEVRDCIRAAAPGGGYILSSSNSIQRTVNPTNYVTMMWATRKWGTYAKRIS